MKKILCYGDSNTFGYAPALGTRFDENTRWTGILAQKLADKYEIIEEGGCNRTGCVDNKDGFLYSAQRHFPKIISKQKDLEILILSVGSNDLQFQYDISFKTFERGIENLIQIAQKYTRNIILIPSVILDENVLKGMFRVQFDETSVSKSKKIGKVYRKLADLYGCRIFDINEFTKPSPDDGLHYNEASHKLIAEKLEEFISNI